MWTEPSGAAEARHAASDDAPLISVVIPVYRSRDTIVDLVHRLDDIVGTLSDGAYEIILVNDSSPDDTQDVILAELVGHPKVLLVELNRNYGQHNGTMAGFAHCRGAFVFTIDDDLQNPPEGLLTLWNELGDLDVLYGMPGGGKRHRWHRNMGSWLIQRYYRMIFKQDHGVSSARLMRRDIVEAILRFDNSFVYIDGLIAWYTSKVDSITIGHRDREHGKSGYTMGKMVRLATNLFTNFSLFPLQAVMTLGILCGLIAFGIGGYYLVDRLFFSNPIPGFTSTVVLVTFLAGIQLFALGVLGEYLGRLHINNNGKPMYHVRRTLRLADHSAPIDEDA